MTTPYFSLIMPAFNRAAIIRRAIDSCLRQSFGNFELIVVDDASTDHTADVVSACIDPRVRLRRHRSNRGPCPARNTAIAAARGDWCVMVDSDFALHEHALERLYERTRHAPASVGNVASSCIWDNGLVTPAPAQPTRILDYTRYLNWIAQLEVSEKLECVRRCVFERVRYPDSRAWEFEFHLDLAQSWDVEISDEVLVTVYSDAPNRLTHAGGKHAVQRVLADAADKLVSFRNILLRHGHALATHAPALYCYTLTRAAHQAFLCGRRADGLRLLAPAFRLNPRAGGTWAAAATGVLGRTTTAWATVLRRQRLRT